MLESLNEALHRLKQEYPITESVTDGGVDLSIEGIEDTFHVWIGQDEFIVSTDEWHEHFGSAQGFENFLRYLLTGRAEIVVTYRGSTPVGHSIETIEDGNARTCGTTMALLEPFWKRKRHRRLSYRLPD